MRVEYLCENSIFPIGPWSWQSNSFITGYSDFFKFCDAVEVGLSDMSVLILFIESDTDETQFRMLEPAQQWSPDQRALVYERLSQATPNGSIQLSFLVVC